MPKEGTYLINIASAPFKLSNLKQPIYCKLRPKIIANYGSFIAHHDNPNYKLLQDYYKLLQKIITNYGSSYFCKIQNYYKLRQVLLHITATFSVITNYGNFYYKLRQVLQIATLLQITS